MVSVGTLLLSTIEKVRATRESNRLDVAPFQESYQACYYCLSQTRQVVHRPVLIALSESFVRTYGNVVSYVTVKGLFGADDTSGS